VPPCFEEAVAGAGRACAERFRDGVVIGSYCLSGVESPAAAADFIAGLLGVHVRVLENGSLAGTGKSSLVGRPTYSIAM